MILKKILHRLYRINSRRVQAVIRSLLYRFEGGEAYSETLRRIFSDYHAVKIGMYTHGGCFVPGNFDRFTTIGRYSSIARTAKTFNRNHPMDWKSTHAIFFNPELKCCDKDVVDYIPLKIGNDVWIGEYAVILPHVTEIGDGAVIGAGACINKNVPPYAVVVGTPARIVRYRFPKEIIEALLDSKWWEQDIKQIKPFFEEFQRPYEQLYFSKVRDIREKNEKNEKKICLTKGHEDTNIH